MKERAKLSDYNYQIDDFYRAKVVLITDLNKGRMSVTNNIENIIDQICFENSLEPRLCFFLYKDSDGVVDGFDYESSSFFSLSYLKMFLHNSSTR